MAAETFRFLPPSAARDLESLAAAVDLLDERIAEVARALPAAPVDEAAQTLERPVSRRRAPTWVAWIMAALGAAYAGWDQAAAEQDRATAAALDRLDAKLDALDDKVDGLAREIVILRAGGR